MVVKWTGWNFSIEVAAAGRARGRWSETQKKRKWRRSKTDYQLNNDKGSA